MRQVVSTPDSAYNPICKLASAHIVQASGAQHTDVNRVQLGEPYRSDPRCNVRLDDAPGIGPLFKGTHIHRYVRPGGPCNSLDERRGTCIAFREQNITAIKYRCEGLRIGDCGRTMVSDRLSEVEHQPANQARAQASTKRQCFRDRRQLPRDSRAMEANASIAQHCQQVKQNAAERESSKSRHATDRATGRCRRNVDRDRNRCNGDDL